MNTLYRVTLVFSILALQLALPIKSYATDIKLTLNIGQIDNQSSNAVEYITPGYMMRVIFSTKWANENLTLATTRLHILIDNKVIVDEKHSFYDGLYQFKSTFTKQIVIPKDLTEGKHILTIRMSKEPGTGLPDQNLVCEPASKEFWIGKPGTASKNIASVAEKKVESVVGTTLENEINPATKAPWECIANDGVTSVKILVNAPDAKSVYYSLTKADGFISENPSLSRDENPVEQGIVVLANNKGEIYFHPPRTIPENLPFKTMNLPQGRTLRYYTSEIVFTINLLNGEKREVKKAINYCRPPVFLVHGFTGDKSTWEALEKMLFQKGFMTNRENYYATNDLRGSMDVGSQAFLLADLLKREREIFQNSNIKYKNADLVCHSMGGLIARFYSTSHLDKGAGVRKIIMVGTPNHGIFNPLDLMTGKMAAYFSKAHTGMAQDVDARGRFMIKLNEGEESGANLNRSIEHGNIYVAGTDGVVQDISARLNGVEEVVLNSMKHSPSIPDSFNYGTKSITTDWLVFGKVINWLINPIPSASLNMNKWNMAGVVTAGKKLDLSGKGHILKVHAGSVTLNVHLKRIEMSNNCDAEIIYPDGSVVKTFPGSKINYNSSMDELLIFTGKTMINLKKQDKAFKVITPTLSVGVRGTCFEVAVDNSGTSNIYLYNGELEITNLSGSKIIKSGQSIYASSNNELNQSSFNPKNRFDTNFANKYSQMTTLENFTGAKDPLFSKVTTGGSKVTLAQTNCLGQLKVQFIVQVGAPSSQQQQMQVKMLSDHNQQELIWFNESEANFKKGIMPKELSGTYRPDSQRKSEQGKYYSQTITLFKPMKIVNVQGEANGFRLARGESQDDVHFSPLSSAIGHILKCGSYKIYVDPNDNIEKTWVTISLE
ncbi:MAG: FecR domain-containing protein [Bacteroidales bacterium]|nr:FecR domain-containing protein [Bacteroidales bacterium]